MARAKRTDRAEARRRYRASLEAQSGEDGDLESTEPESGTAATATATPTTTRIGRASSQASARKGARDPGRLTEVAVAAQAQPGVMGAIKAASMPLDFRGDLARLPLLMRDKSILIPVAIVAVFGIAIQVPSLRQNPLVTMGASLFLIPPPMATPFLAGVLAPRASWLAGVITSLVAAAFYAVFVATFQPGPGEAAITTDARIGQIVYGFAMAVTFGGFIGGFAGFYKRFLKLSNANAARNRASTSNRSKRPAPAKAGARR